MKDENKSVNTPEQDAVHAEHTEFTAQSSAAEATAPESTAAGADTPDAAAAAPGKPGKADKHGAKFAAELAAAKTQAEHAEQQMQAAKDALLRTAAEYDNFRKRSAREHDAAFHNGVSHAIEKLLAVVDTLALAASAETADAAYKKGVELTLDQCKKAFDALGVKEMEALNQPFDPNLHAAVLQQPAPDGVESGTVLQVLQTGYMLGEKVVRHATVAVAE